MAAQNRIGDAVDQAGMLANQRFERVVIALDPTVLGFIALVFTAIDGRRSAQDRLSRHHLFALTHKDRPGARFVQEFLEEERSEEVYLRRVFVGRTLPSASLRAGRAPVLPVMLFFRSWNRESKAKSKAADRSVRPTQTRNRP